MKNITKSIQTGVNRGAEQLSVLRRDARIAAFLELGEETVDDSLLTLSSSTTEGIVERNGVRTYDIVYTLNVVEVKNLMEERRQLDMYLTILRQQVGSSMALSSLTQALQRFGIL